MRALSFLLASAALAATAETGIVYSETTSGARLTMDFYPAAGPGLHPAALVIRTGLDFDPAPLLTPLGIAVFAFDLAPAPAGWRETAGHVRRAIRHVRHHAARWQADPGRLILTGASTGGYIVNLVAVMAGDADRSAKDPVERESAAVQAAIVFHAPADLRGQELSPELRSLLAGDIGRWGEALACSGASPIMHIRETAPPFLLLHGDRDDQVPLAQSAHWQLALQNRGVRSDLIIIENGGHRVSGWNRLPRPRDWQRELVEWLAAALAR